VVFCAHEYMHFVHCVAGWLEATSLFAETRVDDPRVADAFCLVGKRMIAHPPGEHDAARGEGSNQERQTNDLNESPFDLTHPPGTPST
jgi:hypothetical protein